MLYSKYSIQDLHVGCWVPHPHGARIWGEASQRAFHTVPKSAKHAPGPELEPEQEQVWQRMDTICGDKKTW